MKKYKLGSLLFCVLILFASLPYTEALGETVTISSREDFLTFAKNCTLDVWSQGKTFVLASDIDFSEGGFTPVPTFGGTFYGNGHTISGITLTQSGSVLGLFRYVQENATVAELNVKGDFLPQGSAGLIGGIAGENAGIIRSCRYEGNVKGKNVIGGIAGKNMPSGQIISSSAYGSISGEDSTGGICGKNSGLLMDCSSEASVNTVYVEKEKDLSDLDADAGAILEQYQTEKEETEEESVLGHTDTGGVAGYSDGIVQGCVNRGNVGYPHVGYNVGGIAGRQSGYLLGCENYGNIQGRKDVGGIVGQMEPYVLLDTQEGAISDLRREINTLQSMVQQWINDADQAGEEAQYYLNHISQKSQNARSSLENILDQGTDFVDDNLAQINAQTAILSNSIDQLPPALEKLESGFDAADTAFSGIASAFDSLSPYTPEISEELDEISAAVDEIASAQGAMKNAASRAKRAIYTLEDAIYESSSADAKAALSQLAAAGKEWIETKETIRSALEEIKAVLSEKPGNFEEMGMDAEEILKQLEGIAENVEKSFSSVQTILNSLDTLILGTEIDFSAFRTAATNMAYAIEYLYDAVSYITSGLDALDAAFGDLAEKLDAYAQDVGGQISEACDHFSEASTNLSFAAEDIKGSIRDIQQIITDFSKEEPLQFIKLGEDFKVSSETLFQSLSGISGDIDGLKNAVSSDQETMLGHLESVANQFNRIMNSMMDEVENIQGGMDFSGLFIDVSNEDIENTKQGKAERCHNYGTVEADRNIGGVAGAMAIEYSKDPEDDLEKPDRLNFTYRTKCILQACQNDGTITGKKDCAGGIAGLSELGTVYACENYADVSSSGGSYVGGVAGRSLSAISKSYAKCTVEGKSYTGGIAGKAENVRLCYTIVRISGEEYLGSILGACDDQQGLEQNYFVDHGLGAIDGISYAKTAAPIAFDDLKNADGVPKRFISFTVTFSADGKTVATQEIEYGELTAKIRYPAVVPKEGHFGKWEKPESETVTENLIIDCVYQPYITILSSEEKNENGKLSLALAEGEFTDEARLHVTQSKEPAPKDAHGNVKVVDLVLTHTELEANDPVRFRLINENRDKVTAWRLKDGSWEKIKVKEKGKYVVAELEGSSQTVCLKYTRSKNKAVFFIPAAIAVLALALYGVKRKRSVIKKQSEKQDPSEMNV